MRATCTGTPFTWPFTMPATFLHVSPHLRLLCNWSWLLLVAWRRKNVHSSLKMIALKKRLLLSLSPSLVFHVSFDRRVQCSQQLYPKREALDTRSTAHLGILVEHFYFATGASFTYWLRKIKNQWIQREKRFRGWRRQIERESSFDGEREVEKKGEKVKGKVALHLHMEPVEKVCSFNIARIFVCLQKHSRVYVALQDYWCSRSLSTSSVNLIDRPLCHHKQLTGTLAS